MTNNQNPEEPGVAGSASPAELDRMDFDLTDGTMVVFSDCHYRPDEAPSTAHRALISMLPELRPAVVACGGDAMDLPKISKHARIGWEPTIKPADERENAVERMAEVEQAAPDAALFWAIGNHDVRWDQALSAQAGDFEGVPGFCLADHFPSWSMGWSLWLNGDGDDPVCLKHRWAGGALAARNNVIKGGASIITVRIPTKSAGHSD
jgi:hypothetical protein